MTKAFKVVANAFRATCQIVATTHPVVVARDLPDDFVQPSEIGVPINILLVGRIKRR